MNYHPKNLTLLLETAVEGLSKWIGDCCVSSPFGISEAIGYVTT
jgi:hypothetical protein